MVMQSSIASQAGEANCDQGNQVVPYRPRTGGPLSAANGWYPIARERVVPYAANAWYIIAREMTDAAAHYDPYRKASSVPLPHLPPRTNAVVVIGLRLSA